MYIEFFSENRVQINQYDDNFTLCFVWLGKKTPGKQNNRNSYIQFIVKCAGEMAGLFYGSWAYLIPSDTYSFILFVITILTLIHYLDRH